MPSQLWTLIGTLSGVIVGFGLYTLRDYLKDRRELKQLAMALATEVFIKTAEVKESLETLKDLPERLARDEPKIRTEFLEKNEPSLYRANMARVSALQPQIAMGLVVFHELEASLTANAKLMAERFKDYYSSGPIITKKELLEHIEQHKGDAEDVIRVGTALIEMMQKEYKPKTPRAWLVEEGPPGGVRFMWVAKKPKETDQAKG